ncbi:MAG: phage baseplate assembly protein V [bacterium]
MPNTPQLGQGITFGQVTEVNADNPLLVKVSLDDMLMSGGTATVLGGWFETLAPAAGPMRGFYQPPQVGDRVVVAFYNGDLSYGVVLGAMWGPADPEAKETYAPPVPDDDGKRSITAWSSNSPDGKKLGHRIVLDDTKDRQAIYIIDQTGENYIVIDSKNKAMTIETTGELTITAAKKVTFDCGDAEVGFSCKSFTVQCGGDVSLEGSNIDLVASSSLTLQGDGGVKVSGETNINNGALKVTK